MKILKSFIFSFLILIFSVSTCYCAAFKQIDFLLTSYLHPTTGEVLSGGWVKSYLAGTSTLSALKTDAAGVGTADNPKQLNSAGTVELYGDTIYKILICASDDEACSSPLETIDFLEYKTNEGLVSDTAYDKTTWDGVTTIAPSKNVVRDQFQTMLEGFTAEGPIDTNSFQSQWSKGADVASAAALPILTDGNSFDVTGTDAITSINTTGTVGTWVMLQFDGILTFTHHSTNLILPSGEDITTAAGDLALCYEYASGDWRVFYQRADGKALISSLTIGTPQATTSGTSVDFTAIPAGTKRVTVNLSGVSTSSSSIPIFQLGDAGGFETSGYIGSASYITTSVSTSNSINDGFGINGHDAAGDYIGRAVFELIDASTFTWICTINLSRSNTGITHLTTGSKSLSAELTQVRFTTQNGSDTLDAGKANHTY